MQNDKYSIFEQQKEKNQENYHYPSGNCHGKGKQIYI